LKTCPFKEAINIWDMKNMYAMCKCSKNGIMTFFFIKNMFQISNWLQLSCCKFLLSVGRKAL